MTGATRRLRRRAAAWSMLLGMALAAGCGGGGGGTAGGNDPPPPPTLDLAFSGESVVKLRGQGSTWVALAEKARTLEDRTQPERRLWVSTLDGRNRGQAYEPPAGWSLLDFALHPSGEVSVVLGSDRELRLLRLSATGQPLRDQPFTDNLVATDPFVGDPISARDPASLLPHTTRDAARLAPLGEDVALAFRSGRHAVLLHRLNYTPAAGFAKQWRRLVEPGVFIGARFLTSGSCDPFKSADLQWRLALDADTQQRIAVAVTLEYTDLVEGHSQHFGEPVDARTANGLLLSQFSGTGQRVGTAVVDTQQRSELHALRWVGDRVAAAGRVRTQQTAEGWDAFVAFVPASATVPSGYRVLDLEAGDVIFDIALRSDGGLLASGSAGYTQNPTGASISEVAKPLLARLAADGQLQQRVTTPAGPRHNQLRALAPRAGSGWLTGGMENGPGTHSADGNPAALKSDGYLRELRL